MREKSKPFYALLEEARALHDEKGEGYEAPGDPIYPNYRRMERWAKAIASHPELAGSIYGLMRLEEKLERVRGIFEGANSGREPLRETFLDMSVISLVSLHLYQEAKLEKPFPLERETIHTIHDATGYSADH